MRLFIAVPIPEEIKIALRAFQPSFSTKETKIIPEENLHLTLHFIGEFNPDNLTSLQEQLSSVAKQAPPFRLNLQEIAPGPILKNPRLIWARFQQDEAFKNLSVAVCGALQTKPDHPEFIPHITIARFRKNMPAPANLPVIFPTDFPALQVNSVAIWESKLQSPHPEYRILFEYIFGGTNAG